MAERPILFSAPMVRALLAGTKRQTRRTSGLDKVNQHPDGWSFDRWQDGYPDGRTRAVFVDPEGEPIGLVCPYGAPGDSRLWVKETVIHYGNHFHMGKGYALLRYVADGAEVEIPMDNPPTPKLGKNGRAVKTPAIFMRREWSRITLPVESVRVERLQDISEEDAKAEGVTPAPFCKAGRPGDLLHVEAFEDLWREINGAESWHANPWVWVIGWPRVEVTRG